MNKTLFAILSGLLLLASTGVAAAEKPNIIFILVDDLGWMALSCQGSDCFKTSNIDRIAAEGIRFTRAYAACAVCSPTRAAVQTGRYPHRIGLIDYIRARLVKESVPTIDNNRQVDHPSALSFARTDPDVPPRNGAS